MNYICICFDEGIYIRLLVLKWFLEALFYLAKTFAISKAHSDLLQYFMWREQVVSRVLCMCTSIIIIGRCHIEHSPTVETIYTSIAPRLVGHLTHTNRGSCVMWKVSVTRHKGVFF